MNDVLEMMQTELRKVMETNVPRCVLGRESSDSARLVEDFGLKKRSSYASLCMCALVENCLKGNVPAIKQALSLLAEKEVSQDGGVLENLDLAQLFGGEDD